MNIAVSAIVILAITWCVVRLTKIFAGIRSIDSFRCKAEVLRDMKGQNSVPEPNRGISVIVVGLPTQSDIERLMGLEFDNYEIVIIAPLSSDESFAEIKKRYSMTQVNIPAAAEFSCKDIRHLFRSKERRYRKLVMADIETSRGQALNCGLSISSFSRVLTIGSSVRLRRNALRLMDAEFEPCDAGMVCAVCAPIVDPKRFGCDTAVEIIAGDYSHFIALIDRDYAISVGGFSDEEDYLQRMLDALNEIPGLKQVVIPAPLALGRDAYGRFRVAGSKIAVYLLLCSIAIASMFSVLMRRWDLIATLIISLWMIYSAMVAVGVMSAAALKREVRSYPLSKMLLEPFIYPFYPHRGSILEKNFFKS